MLKWGAPSVPAAPSASRRTKGLARDATSRVISDSSPDAAAHSARRGGIPLTTQHHTMMP